MDPVFVRRGKVLFLLKSPADFLKGLKSGKIRPTDSILVKDSSDIQWIPINEIQQYRLETQACAQNGGDEFTLPSGYLFDHIRQPRFNLSALALSSFWYFFHGMPHLGVKRVILTAITLGSLLCVGVVLKLTLIPIILLLILGWFAVAVLNAWRADHDLNRRQIERFHSNAIELGISTKGSNQVPESVLEPPDPRIPTIKEKILN